MLQRRSQKTFSFSRTLEAYQEKPGVWEFVFPCDVELSPSASSINTTTPRGPQEVESKWSYIGRLRIHEFSALTGRLFLFQLLYSDANIRKRVVKTKQNKEY